MDGLAQAHHEMDRDEANFHRVVHYNAGVLWALGAVEETLSALWDVLMRAAGPQGVRAALESRTRQPAGPADQAGTEPDIE